jgi:hypothetical protein
MTHLTIKRKGKVATSALKHLSAAQRAKGQKTLLMVAKMTSTSCNQWTYGRIHNDA